MTQMIADLIEEELLTNVEVVCDFHSGGSSLLYLPSVQFPLQDDGTLSPLARDLVEVHGSPYTHVYIPGDVQCSGAARRKGVLRVSSVFAGAGTVTEMAQALVLDRHQVSRQAAQDPASLSGGLLALLLAIDGFRLVDQQVGC